MNEQELNHLGVQSTPCPICEQAGKKWKADMDAMQSMVDYWKLRTESLESKLKEAEGALNHHRHSFELMKKHGWEVLDIPTINEWLRFTDEALANLRKDK